MYMALLFNITEVVKQKGLEHITVDDLVSEITPKGRGLYDAMIWLFFNLFQRSHIHMIECYMAGQNPLS